MHDPALGSAARDDDWRAFALVAAGMAMTLAAAFGLGLLLKTPPLARLGFGPEAAIAGLAAAGPLALLLAWFMRAQHPGIVAFRERQIGFFAGIGFEFTPLRIAVLATGAGVSEELLFRGVFQTWADGILPASIAILAPNILFGALHWRSASYALLAGAVGVYFGILFAATGDLAAPIIAHGAYDAVALAYTRRAIAQRAPTP